MALQYTCIMFFRLFILYSFTLYFYHIICIHFTEQFDPPKIVSHKKDWFHPEIDRQVHELFVIVEANIVGGMSFCGLSRDTFS